MTARVVILAGVLALLAGVAVAGAQGAQRQLSSNLVPDDSFVIVLEGGQRVCQADELLPEGASAVRIKAGTYGRPGPPLELRAGTAAGRLASGWREGTVVVPMSEIATQRAGEVCLRNAGGDPIALAGAGYDRGVGARVGGEAVGARVRFEYTTADERSWWALLGSIADRMGAVRVGFPGDATMWLWVLLLGGVVAGVAALLLLRPRRPGRAIALLALACALAWGLVIPPFHVPDETAHFYYATYLAQTGEAPIDTPENPWYSAKLNTVLTTMAQPRVIGNPDNRPPWTPEVRAALADQAGPGLDEKGFGDAASATTNSPVYYALQAAAYRTSPSSDLFDRLGWMRLLSAAISALTVVCVYAFLRELLPGSPFAATVGALAAALQPLFGFISAGVNNDGLLYLCSALVLLGLARAFRRGLTPGRGAAIGLALGVGTLVKAQLIAFVPAVALAVLLLRRRDRLHSGLLAWRPALAVAAAAVAPLLVYFVLGQTVWERPAIDRVGTATTAALAAPNATGLASYVWQSYLPRLPFMQDWFPGLPLKNLWVEGLLGRFGWLDYTFPRWVLTLGGVLVALIAVGAVVALVRRRRAVLRRTGELAVYLLAVACFLVVVAAAGYLNRLSSGEPFEQARYLLPLLPFFAAAAALAIQALGPRHVRLLGSLLVLGVLTHTVFAQLLTVSRYYG